MSGHGIPGRPLAQIRVGWMKGAFYSCSPMADRHKAPLELKETRLRTLFLVITLVFGVTFLVLPRNSGGWLWDIGGALGFLAFAGMLFQMIPYPRTSTNTSKRHEVLGYWVLGTAIAHAFWLLTGDGVMHLYLKPGAPFYMWFGLVAIVALAVLAVLARMPDRMRVHRRFPVFRRVHRILAFFGVGSAALHIMLSGFYLPTWSQSVLIGVILLAMCLGRSVWRRLPESPTASGLSYLLIGGGAVGLFVLIRTLLS